MHDLNDSIPPQSYRRTILFIDDDPIVRAALERDLTVLGFSVDSVGSTEEALQLERRYQAIVVDYRLGPYTGFDAIQVLRQRHPHARFVVLSGENNLSVPLALRDITAPQVMHKPWDVAKLSRMLDARGGSEAPPPSGY